MILTLYSFRERHDSRKSRCSSKISMYASGVEDVAQGCFSEFVWPRVMNQPSQINLVLAWCMEFWTQRISNNPTPKTEQVQCFVCIAKPERFKMSPAKILFKFTIIGHVVKHILYNYIIYIYTSAGCLGVEITKNTLKECMAGCSMPVA